MSKKTNIIPGSKKLCGIKERERICELLNNGESVSQEVLFEQVNKIREYHGLEKLDCVTEVWSGPVKILNDLFEELKLQGVLEDKYFIERKNNAGTAPRGILDVYKEYGVRQNQIPEKVIEFVRGNLNYSLLNAIQNWIIDNKGQDKSKDNKLPTPFISIEDSLYVPAEDTEERKRVIEEQKHLLYLAKSILAKSPVKIIYSPLSRLSGDDSSNDTLIFHPEYLRRVGRKWMVYGMSQSSMFGEGYEKYVNLALGRIVEIKDMMNDPKSQESKEIHFMESGIDYSNGDPFKNQMTYHALGCEQLKQTPQTVRLKVRKTKLRHGSNMLISPFQRIQQEKLHYTQQVDGEDADYGYISIRVVDAEHIWPILLSWGGDIEVLEPISLRCQMAEQVRQMAEYYQDVFQQKP